MKENLDTDTVRQLLNHSLSQIDQATLSRLREARNQALTHTPAHAQSPVLAWIDTRLHRLLPAKHHATAWVAMALLVAGLLGGIGYYWQQSHDNNIAVDIAILTDDLPINYYVD